MQKSLKIINYLIPYPAWKKNECRVIIGRTPSVSADGRTDTYSHGVIRPEIVSLTFDSDNKLITVTKRFPDGDVLNILD